MDFDDAKENIQPLAQGRNASILQASLKIDSPQELLAQRKELEKEIHNYSGDDPLSVWYNYIEWIEQSFPSGGKESGLQEVLPKCLSKFETDERYNQDRRMIKLYIKFIDGLKDPAEYYQQLFNAGIGTMVADFYIAWAYCYDLVGNTRRADEIFRRGLSCRAQPFEDLQEAHQHFGFSVAQRLLYKDDDSVKEETNRQLYERRLALTSLRGNRRKQKVGSIRTGSAVKSVMPGTIKIDQPSTSQRGNARVIIFNDENEGLNNVTTPSIEPTEEGKSLVRSIIDATRNQENQKEPGPWNKAHKRKKGKLFGKTTITNDLGFEIHEDDDDTALTCEEIRENEIKYNKPFIYPPQFCAQSRPIKCWLTPVTTEEKPDKNTIPEYNKCKLYPRPNMEFQIEELKAYYILKKRGIKNEFTKERDIYWGCGPDYSIRLYPHFAKLSKQQKTDTTDEIFIPDSIPGLKVAFKEIYNKEDRIERQLEEILALRIKRNETIIKTTDMEETMCITSEKIQRRRSFFPMRKSLAPSALKVSSKMSVMKGNSEIDESSSSNGSAAKLQTIKEYSAVIQSTNCLGNDKSVSQPKLDSVNKCGISVESNQCADEASREPNSLKRFDIYREQSVAEFGKNISLVTKAAELEENDFQLKASSLPPINEQVSGIGNKIQFEIFEDENSLAKSGSCWTGDSINKSSVHVQSNQCIDKARQEPNDVKPFEIYRDENAADFESNVSPVKKPVEQENNFQFKTPSLPPIVPPTSGINNKIQFEIFEDENSISKHGSCETGAFFDPEESCSTQTFNICLKAQSVSTPIAIPKSQAQKQFCKVLKEITPALQEKKEEQQLSIAADNPISPPRQQLSTILETSEHGTTQGTHTTGATTKSTLSSPEFDLEYQTQTTAANQQQPPLEPVKELSCEYSSFAILSRSCVVQNVDKLMGSIKIQDVSDNVSKTQGDQGENLKTPGAVRLQKKTKSSGLDFSIFKDVSAINENQVGNFSRLKEREDTATEIAMPSIRFQDDKTETITKFHITSQQLKFQDDKTETIPKVIFKPNLSVQFSEDKTENISNILLGPPQSVKFPEDNTETSSKCILAPSQPTQPKDLKSEIFKPETLISDDTFEFFGHTPPKTTKYLICKQSETRSISKMRTSANMLTPITLDAKRFCEKDTPDLPKFKSKVLFKNEVNPLMKSLNKEDITKVSANSENDSSQSKLQQNKTNFTQSKTIFRDSFIPGFSIIEDSSPVSRNLPESKIKPTNNSYIPKFSLNENKQPKLSNSIDVSFVPETQPDVSIIKSSQPIDEPKILNQNFCKNILQLPYDNDLPEMTVEESKVSNNIHWKQTPKPKSVSNTTQEGTNLKNILMDSFMKDFSEINEPKPLIPKGIKDIILMPPLANNSLKFLSESIKNKPENNASSNTEKSQNTKVTVSTCRESKLSFLTPVLSDEKYSQKEKRTESDNNKYFELNCETEMFGTNISMIKNSTWLPNHGPAVLVSNNNQQISQIQENSLHIKQEEISLKSSNTPFTLKSQLNNKCEDIAQHEVSCVEKSVCNNDFSIEMCADINEIKLPTITTDVVKSIVIPESPENDDNCEMSIYYKTTPKTPKPQIHVWDDADDFKSCTHNQYVHAEADLNQTNRIIENMCIDPNVNPFNVDLINAFLEQHYVISYLESLPTCELVGCVQRLKPHAIINIKGINFKVLKLIGEGAYGAVFCGKEVSSEKLVAMKQEKPPNYWEYYICLEIQERIRADEMLPAYMSIDHALIGNNSSILISRFSQYGSLITVCNKIKKHTMKNVDEYVVMLLASELLEIIDHLHAVNVIHADIKADNFLLMNKLTYPPTERCLQLIDFGVSIDMKLFKEGQVFNFIHNDNAFKCPEMREQRPWTYQLDLYGLAGVFHVLLFGKYMDIEKKARGFWMHKTHVPRYLNKSMWDEIFKTLLNIRDCNSMPNLQDLRAILKKEIEEKEKYVIRKVNEFNNALIN